MDAVLCVYRFCNLKQFLLTKEKKKVNPTLVNKSTKMFWLNTSIRYLSPKGEFWNIIIADREL